MREAYACLTTAIEELATLAAPLGWKLPRVRDPATAEYFARNIHKLLVRLAKGRQAIDVTIGENLDLLTVGLRAMDLGYSKVTDYAREVLGIAASTAAKMERTARRLRDLPVIRQAVLRGQLTARKAEIIAQVATVEDQGQWLIWGRNETVRALQARARLPQDPDEERWLRLSTDLPKGKRPAIDTALGLAGMVLEKPTASKMERVTAWCQEYRSSHEALEEDGADDVYFREEDDLELLKKALEQQNRQWADLLGDAGAVLAPVEDGEIDPFRIDATLRELGCCATAGTRSSGRSRRSSSRSRPGST